MRRETHARISGEELEQIVAEVKSKLNTAITLFREREEHSSVVRTLGKLAHVERDMGEYFSACSISETAVSLARTLDNPALLAHSVRHLGEINWKLGNQSEALRCFSESISSYRQITNPPPLDLANALTRLASITELNDREEAAILWKEARDLYASLGLVKGVHECEIHLEN